MKQGNKLPEMIPKKEFIERNPSSVSLTKLISSPSTAEFSTYEGVSQNKDIEQALLDRGFIPIEKILTRDNNGNVICHFIKSRDNLGHEFYVELDTTCKDGMGFLTVNPQDMILTESNQASVIPYSLKVGSFEASNNNLYGVGFECDNSICIMSRKDSSLDPVETVFTHTKNTENDMGIQDRHPIPFPIVKMTEILANPKQVQKNIAENHNKMRNIAFNSCSKDVESMRHNANELQEEINKFGEISSEVSNVLSCTIDELEKMYSDYEKIGSKCEKDLENMKIIQFNLNVRQNLNSDYIALCHSMRERSSKIKVLVEELKSLNEFSKTLFTGIKGVLIE